MDTMKKKLAIKKLSLLALSVGLWASLLWGCALNDREPPVIEPHEVTANYNTRIDIGELASITDEKDDAPSISITYCDPKAGTVDKEGQSVTFSKIGNYVVKVTGQDSSENAAEAEVSVKITDGTPPVIKVKNAEFAILDSVNASDIGSASDEIDKSPTLTIIACDGNAEIAKGGQSITFRETGEMTVGLSAVDSSANTAKESFKVKVINTIVPEIKLSEKEILIADTDANVDFASYVTANSAVYGDLTKDVVVDASTVKLGTPGNYMVKYAVTDRDGNSSTADLSVVISDTTAPVFSDYSTEFVLTAGDEKPDYLTGLAASDSFEGDMTGKVVVDDSGVDYTTAGTYAVIFTVADAAGNTAWQQATVTVREKVVELPVETIQPSTPEAEASPDRGMPVESGTTYVLNTNTGKFHHTWCGSVSTIKNKNRKDVTGSRDEVIAKGYDPCKRCNP